MISQQPQRPDSDWTKTKVYAGVMLLATFVGAGVQVLLVPPAWWPIFRPPNQGQNERTAQGPTSQEPEQVPPQQSSPMPVVKQPAGQTSPQQKVCGVWLSTTSQKRYNFVCQGNDSFEIYEVTSQGANKNGSGKLTGDGNVEASLLASPKNRWAHMKLRLSDDGQRLQGSWRGDDPRESGQLMFYRV